MYKFKYTQYNNFKCLSSKFIKKNEIICVEKPYLLANSEIEMLNLLINNKNDENIINLYPRNLSQIKNFITKYNSKNNKYLINFKNIKTNMNYHELFFYYCKFLFNAFKFNDKIAILLFGSKINHSENPNIYFYEENNKMIFKALRNIHDNEELNSSYFRNIKNINKKKYLNEHYDISIP